MSDFNNKNIGTELIEELNDSYNDKLIKISRVAKVVKGGRRFSFSALVAVGDKNGKIGIGFGKANEVADAIVKASNDAKKNINKINLTKKRTIPHEIIGEFKSSKVIMMPAAPGTGVIAGGAVRSIMEVLGVTDILAKVMGSKNQMNVTKATINALLSLKDIKEVAKRRGKKITDLF
ncbi:MAG: 30S ribosomal protein S5 [Spirochaetes bacterium GWD1_27_9]|nr:MAG: 30S ribosomal protein S5 [Spirochaetes bacterium GWB1_27_13]OHD21037.1 MAG: 30S ribosomal protein S5 [Spirochaetes bacterium GWC1_27_15]OHD45398.1 MAG: 30S ribosomal protein S5 [Spirochaetes bacterium GWD1_27_9]